MTQTLLRDSTTGSTEAVQYLGDGVYQHVWGGREEMDDGPGCYVFFRRCDRDHALLWVRAIRRARKQENVQ